MDEIEYLETPHGLFTSNPVTGQTAQEVYDEYLYSLEHPQPVPPTIEERITALEAENATLKEYIKSVEEGSKNGIVEITDMVATM